MSNSLLKYIQPQFTKDECKNNNHYFVRYNEGNMICEKCGRFAKIGFMSRENKE